MIILPNSSVDVELTAYLALALSGAPFSTRRHTQVRWTCVAPRTVVCSECCHLIPRFSFSECGWERDYKVSRIGMKPKAIVVSRVARLSARESGYARLRTSVLQHLLPTIPPSPPKELLPHSAKPVRFSDGRPGTSPRLREKRKAWYVPFFAKAW